MYDMPDISDVEIKILGATAQPLGSEVEILGVVAQPLAWQRAVVPHQERNSWCIYSRTLDKSF